MSEAETVQQVPGIVKKLRGGYSSLKTLPKAWREAQLLQLRRLLVENRAEICAAIGADLGMLKEMANVNEVGSVIQEIDATLSNLDAWMAPEARSLPLTLRPGKGYIVKEPYGTVCIIAPWNYPFRLLALPLVGALSAGNTVLLKPSEVAQNTSHLIKKLIDKYFDPQYVAVVEGGIEVSKAVLAERFDYMFYTGNTEVGRVVMRACAEHLTPMTLELGGKSPCIVDKNAKLDVAANRILFGKVFNNGQTCVAPDYVLVSNEVKAEFIKLMQARIVDWLKDPKTNKDYSRIINTRHAARLQSYLEPVSKHIVQGGQVDVADRFVAPTLVLEPPLDSKLMQEEIFGPILPIIGVNSMQEAVQFVNAREKPLALYVFSENEQTRKFVVNNTSSGGVAENTAVLQVTVPDLPFGGVGPSGMGAYNGQNTFDTFTHRKSVMYKPTWPEMDLMYPPYTEFKLNTLNQAADGLKIPTKLIVGAVAGLALAGYVIKSRL